MNKRILYCSGILIVIIFFLGLFFIFTTTKRNINQKPALQVITPTPTLIQSTAEIINKLKVTGGMRQFESKQYGFSFSYPYDWQILDEPNVVGVEVQKINSQGMGFSISLRINDNPQKLPLEDYAKSQVFNSPSGVKDIPQKITVGTLQGYKLQYLPEGLLTTIYLPYKQPDKVLYIFAGGEFNKSPQTIVYYNQIIDNVLNTLRFY